MKQSHITRRQFFKLSAFGAGTVAASSLVGLVAAPSKEVLADAEAPQLAIPQPTFNAIASTTAFGPPTDIAAGWDGTLWAIDASGAPHLYDPTSDAWLPHGDGIDASALIGNTLYLFRANQYVTVDLATNQTSDPKDIGTTWPSLPDSFKLGVSGASGPGDTLYLIKGGWFIPADMSQPPAKLSAMTNWPTTANWQDGLIDAAISGVNTILIRNGEFIVADIQTNWAAPVIYPISQLEGLPAAWQTTGVNAGITLEANAGTIFYKGNAVAVSPQASTGTPQYIPTLHKNWPATWNPRLQHAPSGRMGNLWACLQSTGAPQNMPILQHDGDQWNVKPGLAYSASVGQDDEVFVVSTAGLFRWHTSINNYDFWGSPFQMNQVAVGDAGHVWVRDSNNTVHQFTASNTHTVVNLGAGIPAPTHMAANTDGTLWHCNSSNANTFRLISESTNPSETITVKGGVVTGVQKVASTGFGAAHCLVTQNGQSQSQVYRYDSPYVFKTSKPYFTVKDFAQGLGNLYLIGTDGFSASQIYVLALDAHTGREVARSQGLSANPTIYTGLAFDPINELVYASVAPDFDNGKNDYDNTTPGQLLALDARTLAVMWAFQTPNGIDAIPALSGTSLCFGDRSNTIYMFDTRDALAAAAKGQSPTPKWTWTVPTVQSGSHRVAPPVLANGQVYTAVWAVGTVAIGGQEIGHYPYFAQCNAEDGSNPVVRIGDFVGDNSNSPFIPGLVVTTPVLAPLKVTVSGRAVEGTALIATTLRSVTGFFLESGLVPNDHVNFTLPGTARVVTGLAYDNGTRRSPQQPAAPSVWFGDVNGTLYALGSDLLPIHGTPYQAGQSQGNMSPSISGTPVLYIDTSGNVNALFGMFAPLAGLTNLFIYSEGNLASISTGATQITALTPVTNGVMYLAGSQADSAFTVTPQVFGIKVDQSLFQSLRDFVIESQMLQDPDPTAPGGDPSDPANPVPPSRARYQTHLTVVDDQKAPQPHEPIKIWADAPMTLMIAGKSFDVGPGDAQYAAVKTGTDGSLVITSGYAKPDGSDTPDMYAAALRVWAGFMDAYERIVVYPDHEFHSRVTTAHANASDDDPDKVNLVTTRSYAGRSGAKPTPLFTPDEQKSGQPQNCANAIGQMKTGVGLGGAGNSVSSLFNRLMLHASGHKSAQRALRAGKPGVAAATTTASPPKYVAYTDLTGSGYFPTNIPAQRPTTVGQPTGLIFSKPKGQPTTTTTLSVVHHTDAQAAIDALPPPTANPPWVQTPLPLGERRNVPVGLGEGVGVSQVLVIRRSDNIFTDFWNWLKNVVAEITDLIVTIADGVMVGIRMIVNGVEQIFKAIVKVIDDIASAIGSFFKMLIKVIEDVIAALSVLFHFGEIIQTHKWIRDQINTNLQQAIGAMQTQVKPPVDKFFAQGEQAIETLFSSIRQKLGIEDDTQVNSVNGARSTSHTAFTAGPGTVGPNGSGSSHAVQCTHTTQKMKTGLPSATQPALSTPSSAEGVEEPAVAADDDDVLSAFVANFVNSLQTNPTISTAFNNLKGAINNIGQSQSAGDFFKSALNLLLTIIEDLILGIVAVTQALVDGLIGAIEALINTVVSLLNTPVDIPFISWLYQLIFGEPLTILNAVSLVAAIPVTIIYRVVEGHYPSQDGITGSAADVGTASTTAITPDVIKKMQGLIGGTIALGLGIVRGVVDEAGANPPRIGTIFVLTFGVFYVSTYFPLMIPGATPTPDQWAEWGLGVALALLGTFGIIDLKGLQPATQAIFKGVLTFLRVGLAVARFIVFVVAFAQGSNRNAVADVQFARSLFLELPPMFNWLKLLPEPANIVLTVIDVVTGIVVCALDITAAFLTTSPAPSRRLYFPWVPHSPMPATAHP